MGRIVTHHDKGKRSACLHKPMKAMSVADVLYSMRFSEPVELPVIAMHRMRNTLCEVTDLRATKWCVHCCFA